MQPTRRTGVFYKVCGARIARGAALGLLAFGILLILSGVGMIVAGALLFDDSSYCWNNAYDAGNECWQLNLLIPGVLNTIGGVVMAVMMVIAIRSKPEVTGTGTAAQGFVTTGGYPHQPGMAYYGAAGVQQPGMAYYATTGPQQPTMVQAPPANIYGGQYVQAGAPNYGYTQGQMQPGMPNQ